MDLNLDTAIKLIIEKIEHWATTLIKMVPNLLVASIALIIGIYIAKRIRRFADNKFRRFFPTKTLADLSISIIYVFLLGAVGFIVLRILNLDKTITTALAGAGIAGVALAFAFQDIAANFISGIFMSLRRPFYVGDAIRVKEFEGFVKEMKIRDTTIQTYQGQLVTIPNKDVFQNALINYTRLGKRRADVTGGVSKNADLRKVQEVALEALKHVPNAIVEDTTFFYEHIGEETIDFKIRIWVKSGDRVPYLNFMSEVIIHLSEAFKENDIKLPDPVRVIQMDSTNDKKGLDDIKKAL